jgi:hypothetical protein
MSSDVLVAAVPAGALEQAQVVHLRVWGTDRTHPLPARTLPHAALGADERCAVRIADPSVASFHAHLQREPSRWLVRALDGQRDLRLDGAPCDAFALAPGAEIGVGDVTLVAESPRAIALRGFCYRLLGWGADRGPAVDRALRAIRLASMRRAPLYLFGEGDLAPLALILHRRAFGAEQPFVLCDPRRRNRRQNVRAAANQREIESAVRVASGGTLCVRSPPGAPGLGDVLGAADPQTRLIVCCEQSEIRHVTPPLAGILVPALHQRRDDADRLVDEYLSEALVSLGAAPTTLRPEDRTWMIDRAATSHVELEKTALRLAAVRSTPNLRQAAMRLGMAQVSLTRWLARKGLET